MLYNNIILEPFLFFCVMYDHMTMICDTVSQSEWQFVIIMYNIILTPNSKSKNKNRNKMRNEK